MEQEKDISPNESLNLIQKIIHSSQNKYSENGVIIMLASGLFALASIVDYILCEMKIAVESIFIYIIPFFIVMAYRQFFYPTSEEKKFQSFTDEYFGYFIAGFNMTAYLIGIFCMGYHIPAAKFELILVANFCYVSSLLFNKNKFFAFGCAINVIAATLCNKFVGVNFYPLIIASALFIGVFIPALFMYLKSKKESV
jgi:hypothetical protein